jgi:hypothetical protein
MATTLVVPSGAVYRPETLINRSGNSVDAPYQRFGRTVVELAI